MTDVPDLLTLKRHRDLDGMARSGIWWRRAILLAITGFALAGLANVFGLRLDSVSAVVPAAKISVYAPSAKRGGDFMEARIHITAKRDLKKAPILLVLGWAEGMSLNTVEPSPIGQASDNGRLSFDLGHIPAGQSFILFMQFQVNPTNLAWNRPQNVELDDGDQVLAVVHHSITIFP